MALFDEPMLDVDTPKGPMRLPASVAQALGLTPPQPEMVKQVLPGELVKPTPLPPAPTLPPPPPQTPVAQGGGRKGGSTAKQDRGQSLAQGGPGPLGEVAQAAGMAQAPIAPAPQPDAMSGAAEQTPAPPAPPAPAQPDVTTNDLRSLGIAGSLNFAKKALDDATAAGQKVADTEADQQLKFADAYVQRNNHIDDLLKKRADEAEAKQKEIDNRLTDYDSAVKKYADTKIDRSVDHPILAAISLALGGLGAAMQNKTENPALTALYAAIDRKVQGQLQDQAKQRDLIQSKRSDIDLLRQRASDSTAQYNLAISGEIEKAARQVEAIGARSNSDVVRARAAEAAAQMRQKGADALGNAVMAQQAKDERDRSFAEQQRNSRIEQGIQYGHLQLGREQLAEQKREHDLQRQDKLDEMALGYAKLGDKERAAAAKETAAKGIFDPTSGHGVLMPEGQAKMDKADQLERQARGLPDAQANTLRQQAKALRDDAEATNTFTIEDKEQRGKVIESVGAGQKLIDTVAKIKRVLAQDPSSVDRNTWAELGTDFERAKTQWIEAHGAKPSSREMQAVEEMFGDSPNSMALRVAGRGKLLEHLKALEQGAISETTIDLRKNGYKGQWRPREQQDETPAELSGTTSVEAASDAYHPLGDTPLSFTSNKDRMRKAENAGPVTATGLAPQDDATVRSLMGQYANASDADRSRILSNLTSFAASDRTGNQVIGLLRSDPGLYNQVVSQLPPAQREQIQSTDKQVLAATPIDMLTQGAMAGDAASKMEIARRAAAGDRAAQMAAHQVIQSIRGAR